jgi:tetratricopeptide (TPR) repeat protein
LYLVAEYFPYILLFPLGFVIGAFRFDQLGSIDGMAGQGGKLADGKVIIWLGAALVTFIAADLVNFALFEPSTQFLCFFLCGLLLASVKAPEPTPTSRRNLLPAVDMGVLAIGYLVWVTVPAARSEAAAARAERTVPSGNPAFDEPYERLSELAEAYPFDAHLPAQAGQRLVQIAQQNRPIPSAVIEKAAEYYALACRRAPAVYRFWGSQAQCYVLLADLDRVQAGRFFTKAEELYEQALARAPRSRTLPLTAGVVYWQHAQNLPETQTPRRIELARRSERHLKTALRLNDALSKNSLRRLPESKLAHIRTMLSQIEDLLKQSITRPAQP